MAKARQGGSDDPSHLQLRSIFRMRFHEECDRSLKKLEPPDGGQVLARIQRFFGAWKSGQPEEALHNSWDYKLLKGKAEKALGLRQIHVGKHRAVLLIVNQTRTIWVLEAFLKGTVKAQQSAISRAVTRAQELLEGK